MILGLYEMIFILFILSTLKYQMPNSVLQLSSAFEFDIPSHRIQLITEDNSLVYLTFRKQPPGGVL